MDPTNLSIEQNLAVENLYLRNLSVCCMINWNVNFLCSDLIKDYHMLFVIKQCVLTPGIHHKEKNS